MGSQCHGFWVILPHFCTPMDDPSTLQMHFSATNLLSTWLVQPTWLILMIDRKFSSKIELHASISWNVIFSHFTPPCDVPCASPWPLTPQPMPHLKSVGNTLSYGCKLVSVAQFVQKLLRFCWDMSKRKIACRANCSKSHNMIQNWLKKIFLPNKRDQLKTWFDNLFENATF